MTKDFIAESSTRFYVCKNDTYMNLFQNNLSLSIGHLKTQGLINEFEKNLVYKIGKKFQLKTWKLLL